MANFGLDDLSPDEPSGTSPVSDMTARLERLASITPVAPRRIDTVLMDQAAAPHGFTSREPTPQKRRRVAPRVPRPCNMGIRLSEAEKARFIAFADKHCFNYTECLVRLLDIAEGKN